jgi:hypothetical protein
MKGKGPIIVVVFSLLIAVFMAFVSLLPNTLELESNHVFNNSKEEIIDYLATSENWKNWLFFVPKSELEYIQNGPQNGEGAGFKWFSNDEGDGVIEIIKVSNTSVSYEMVTDNGQFRERGTFIVKEKGTKAMVTWQDTLDVSTSLFGRWAARTEGFARRINKKNLSTLIKIDSLLNDSRNYSK